MPSDKPSWQECARLGMTYHEAAQARGVTVGAAHKAATKLRLRFKTTPRGAKPGDRRRPLSPRYAKLAEQIASGLRLFELAALYGVSSPAILSAMRTRGLKFPAKEEENHDDSTE